MKTAIFALTALAVTMANNPRAAAGDREWATAGKVLTGVVAGTVLLRALEPRPVVATTYVYPAPTVVAAAPVVVQPSRTVVQTVPPPPPGTVYVQPAPVYYAAPAPVYVQSVPVYAPPPRVYMAPPPGFYVNVGYARGFYPRPHRVVCW